MNIVDMIIIVDVLKGYFISIHDKEAKAGMVINLVGNIAINRKVVIVDADYVFIFPDCCVIQNYLYLVSIVIDFIVGLNYFSILMEVYKKIM